MIYVLAVLYGLILCVLGTLSEVTESNIRYMKAGLKPDAGAVLFPLIFVLPLMLAGVAWLLEVVIPAYAIRVFAGAFLILLVCWWRSYARSKVELKRLIDSQNGKLG